MCLLMLFARYISPGTHCFEWHSFPPCTALVFLLLVVKLNTVTVGDHDGPGVGF